MEIVLFEITKNENDSIDMVQYYYDDKNIVKWNVVTKIQKHINDYTTFRVSRVVADSAFSINSL